MSKKAAIPFHHGGASVTGDGKPAPSRSRPLLLLFLCALVFVYRRPFRGQDLFDLGWARKWNQQAASPHPVFPHPVNASHPPVDPHAESPVGPWQPCPEKQAQGSECAYVRVPKDYFDKSKGHAYVAVSRLPATAPPKEQLGAIYLNPGGPGGSGIGFATRFGRTLQILTHGKYDIIGFDPRGIGATRPLVDCFGSTRAYDLFKAGTALERPFDVAPNPFSEEGREVLLRQWTETQALKQAEMELCVEKMGDELIHMSTNTVVRDISYLNFEAGLGKGKRINFMGYSYGTIIGSYLANMLPASSLGHVVIDGVVSAPGWSSMPPEYWLPAGWMRDAEKAYDWVLQECFEAGDHACAVARASDKSAQDIKDRLDSFLDDLYHQPLAIPDGPRPGILTNGIARAAIFRAALAPSIWPLIASFLEEAMAGNGRPLYELIIAPISEDPSEVFQLDVSRAAVGCGDAPPYGEKAFGDWPIPTPELLLNLTLGNIRDWTPNFAATAPSSETDGGCQWHPATGRTPERFHGPWNNTLDTPMLIISNTADPVTPRSSGQEINKLMGKSASLLTVNAPGHTSLSSTSSCSFRVLQDYLLRDQLPKEGLVCERDEGDFSHSWSLHRFSLDAKLENAVSDADLLQLSRHAARQNIKYRHPHLDF